MPMLNIFESDAFTLTELTDALNTVPVVPGLLGQMGLFTAKPISSLTISVEEKAGWLYLIPTSERGTANRVISGPRRKMRDFRVPHYPVEMAVYADDATGLRQFGSENTEVPLNTVINDKLTMAKGSHQITEEFARIGCVTGVVLDADGSTIYDYYSEFGLTEESVSFNFSAGVNPKVAARSVITKIKTALGAIPYTRIVGLCSTSFYDALTASPVVEANMKEIDARFPIDQQLDGIVYGNITWIPYDGEINGNPIIADGQVRFFPLGVPGLFQEVIAPADIMEAVGTLGLRYYAVPERIKFNKGVDIHTQHNILPICSRPAALVKGTDDTP